MNVLVLGGTGMLGHKLFQVLRPRFPGTLCTTRQNVKQPPFQGVGFLQGSDVISGVDAMDMGRLEGLLRELRPDYVLNCVGVIKQRDAATQPIPTITINSLLPHKLAEWAASWGGRVIHFSTDCVFSGLRGGYTETDQSDAHDLYGKSKFLGEVHEENALTLRSSIIGRELTQHQSLLDWFLAQNGKKVRGFHRVIYSGLTTNEMANVVAMVLENYPTLTGLHQVVSAPISKYDLLGLVRQAYGLELEIERDETIISDRSMCGEKFRAATGYIAPSWTDLVGALAADPTPYEEWVRLR